MTDDDFDAQRFIELAAALNGIPPDPDRYAGVIMNFENFRALHARVRGDGAPNPLDPAGLFRP
jgi:hypothetical protein